MKDKITIKTEEGEKEYDIVFSFTKNKEEIITYTDYKKDENNNIKCYSCIFEKDGKIKEVKDPETLQNIKDILKTITETTKAKYQVLNKEGE